MSATKLNFSFLAGDGSVGQQFLALDPNTGTVMSLASATEISFAMRRSMADPVLLTKLKSTGGITIVNAPGTDGKFLLTLLAADTAAFSGFYLYQCAVTIAALTTVVVIGSVQAGPVPAWTYSGDPTFSQKDAVRFLVGDTISTDQQIPDPEILFAIQTWGSIWRAAAMCARSLAARLSRTADTVQGDLHVMYANRSRAYAARAAELDNIAIARGGGMPYAGGISIFDKDQALQNSDRVMPQFQLGMEDNWIPVGPAGNESLTSAPTPVPP